MKYNRNVYQALAMIGQFGVNMLVPIFICTFLGIFIDRYFGTSYWAVALFFVGALAGFTNVFRFARRIYETPAQTRRRVDKRQHDGQESRPDEVTGYGQESRLDEVAGYGQESRQDKAAGGMKKEDER